MHLNRKKQSAGFALIAAVFLIVVVGLVIVYMQRLSSGQASINAVAVQNARAQQAALSGLEWGVYRAWNAQACPAASTDLADISGFSVRVICSSTAYAEAGATTILFTIDSRAQLGSNFSSPALTNPDYVFKRIRATVEVGS